VQSLASAPDRNMRYPLEPLVQGTEQDGKCGFASLDIKLMANSKQQISEKKLQLRRQLRAKRSQAAQTLENLAHQALISQLRQLSLYATAKKIAIYLPIGSEFPTATISVDALSLNKEIYIPRITSSENHAMQFCLLQYDSQGEIQTKLLKNIYNIPEPEDLPENIAISVQALDIIFMPLLGFNPKGDRLGMGGGYYDRTLEFKNHTPSNPKPYLIGLAYETQLTHDLYPQPWDIKLDAVITEKQIYHFNSALL